MSNKEVMQRISRIKSAFPDVECKYVELESGACVLIIRGGFTSPKPKEYMDNVVSELVGKEPYNEFIEKFLDNPWIRIIIFDFNNIVFK